MKQFKQISEVTIRPATNDGAEKLNSDIESSFTSPTLSKKTRRLPKKYLQLNRTATTPQFSSVEESKAVRDSSTPAVKIFKNGKAKNGSLPVPPTIVHSVPIEKPKSHREWNVQGSSVQAKSQFTSRPNNSNVINVNNLKSLNVPSDAVQSRPKYKIVPRPFSILQSSSPSIITTNVVQTSYRKPSVSPTGFNHQQQITRSSANVLPTDLFTPPSTRRYVPIKRTNHLNLVGNSATIVSTEASPPTSPVGERSTLADYNAVYAAVIGTTRNPLVTVNSQQSYSPSDYYAITDGPTERSVTKTNFATYAPSQTSALYTIQQQKDSQAIPKNDFLPRASYNSHEKSSLNENPGIALYNKFSSLYSTNIPNVFNAPKAITQDFKQPVQQPSQRQVLTHPQATSKPFTPASLKVRPITSSTPYYDSELLVSQDRKYNTNNAENDETNEQSRIKDEDETEKEDDDSDYNDDIGKYKSQINRKVYETPNTREKKDREEGEEDRYPQQSRNYGYQDKAKHKYENDRNSKNDDRREKYENVQHEYNDDEDEAEEEEYVGIGKSKDEDNDAPRRQYNKYDNDEDSDEEPRYERKKNNKPKDRRDKHESDVQLRFESNSKYLESLYNDDNDEISERNKEYRDRSDKNKLVDDNRYRKDRKYEESEDESVAEDKPIVQRAYKKDQSYEEEQSDNDKRKYRYQVFPRKDTREEYGETNPAHTREEYHHHRVKSDYPRHDGGNQDDGKGEEHDPVHGETQEHAHKHEEHHEKKKGGGDHDFEEGGGGDHKEEHHAHGGEKGDKVNLNIVCSSDFI